MGLPRGSARAAVIPTPNVSSRTTAGVARPNAVSAASSATTAIAQIWVTMR